MGKNDNFGFGVFVKLLVFVRFLRIYFYLENLYLVVKCYLDGCCIFRLSFNKINC